MPAPGFQECTFVWLCARGTKRRKHGRERGGRAGLNPGSGEGARFISDCRWQHVVCSYFRLKPVLGTFPKPQLPDASHAVFHAGTAVALLGTGTGCCSTCLRDPNPSRPAAAPPGFDRSGQAVRTPDCRGGLGIPGGRWHVAGKGQDGPGWARFHVGAMLLAQDRGFCPEIIGAARQRRTANHEPRSQGRGRTNKQPSDIRCLGALNLFFT